MKRFFRKFMESAVCVWLLAMFILLMILVIIPEAYYELVEEW